MRSCASLSRWCGGAVLLFGAVILPGAAAECQHVGASIGTVHEISNCGCGTAHSVSAHSHGVQLLNIGDADCDNGPCPTISSRTGSISVSAYSIPGNKKSVETKYQHYGSISDPTVHGDLGCGNAIIGCIEDPCEISHYIVAQITGC